MSKKIKQKMSKAEITFNIFSLIFLVGFSCFYGYRMIHYKNKLAPKTSDAGPCTISIRSISERFNGRSKL